MRRAAAGDRAARQAQGKRGKREDDDERAKFRPVRSRAGKDSCGVGFIADIKGRKSHQIVEDALTILVNLEHRGAVGADPRAGDGAGILVQIPHAFFAKKAAELGFTLPRAGRICRRRAVHAAGRGVAQRDHGHLSPTRSPRRGHDAARLARRADRQFDARRNRQADRAGQHAGVHRPRQPRSPTRTSSSAGSTSCARRSRSRSTARASGARRLLPGVDVVPHA